jgi:ferritin-like metal-binding protein YciE
MAETRTMTSETLQTIFIGSLRNTHALEKEALQLLQRQIERSGDYPEVEQKLRQHLDETKRQEERIDEILHSFGEDRSLLKDWATQFMGNMAALAHAPASDEILKNAFANNAFENYEIAAYKSLMTIAEAAGQSQWLPALRQTLQEEQRMAEWCASNIENLTRKYLMREEGASR